MLRGLFVTGTDTGVGKTVVSAALLHRYRAGSPRLRYWKPIQTGIEQDDDSREAGRLGGAAEAVVDRGVRLPRPLSPHLAARLHGEPIDLEALVALARAADEEATVPNAAGGGARVDSARWIVEGAGGVLVPINDFVLMPDLIRRLALPALVVARSGLGTINHTLLSVEALRTRSIPVAGVVMVGDANPENRDAIERYGRVRVLGEMPRFDPLTPDALGRWAASALDPEAHLAPYIGPQTP